MDTGGSVARTVLRSIRNPISSWPRAVYEDKVYLPGVPGYVLIMDPDAVRTVLLDRADDFPHGELFRRIFEPLWGRGLITSQGGEWRWQRQAVAPAFRPAKLASLVPAIVRSTSRAIARWRRNPSRAIEASAEGADLALDILIETVLGGAESFRHGASRRRIAHVISEISRHRLSHLLPDPLQRWLPRPATRESALLRQSVLEMIAQRRAGHPRGDLVDQLIAAVDPESGRAMDDGLLADNLLGFLAAGHDTVAAGLCWSLYIMALYPDIARRMREEACAEDLAAAPGRPPDLPYTRQVVQEVLRLYPPAPILVRQCHASTSVGGIDIVKGDRVVIPIYAIHRHRAYWRDPAAFDPDRFASTEPAPGRYVYFPFGAGRRICIGSALSMLELTVALAHIARVIEPELLSTGDIEPVAGISLKPSGDLLLRLRFHE